jgi:hypothetical protein
MGEEEGLRMIIFFLLLMRFSFFFFFPFVFSSSLPQSRRGWLQVHKGVQHVDLQPDRGLAGAKKFTFRVVHR